MMTNGNVKRGSLYAVPAVNTFLSVMSRNKPKKERGPKEGSNDPIKDKVLSHPMTMQLLWTTHFKA